MLTFLRKIRKSLVESGNARKPASPTGRSARPLGRYLIYAIGELLLVVVGIMIALQINNWNEYKKERKTEVNILKDIVENLEINIKRLEANIERGKTDNEIADIIIAVIDQEIPYSDTLHKHFPLALNAVDEGSFLSFVGYESLKNTGFEIIRDDKLRKEIVNLFEGTYKDLRARYDRIERGSTGLREFTDENFYRTHSNFNREFTPYNFNHLTETKKLMSWLIRIKGYREWISTILLKSHSETEMVLQLIENELSEIDK